MIPSTLCLKSSISQGSSQQASTLGNADSRYQGAYTASSRVQEADPALAISGRESGREADGLSVGLGAELPDYLESIAKSIVASNGAGIKCPGWVVVGECLNGHRFAKELYCGREWCPECGAKWSPVHQRRFARWLPKAQQVSSMGYLVVTFPVSARARLRTKKGLSRVGIAVRKVLQRRGIARGLRRWHWFGEGGQGGPPYHPHLNVLVDGGYRGRAWLRGVRREIARLVGERDIVVHYQFSRKPGKMVFWLKYVTRATFLDQTWDEPMANELYNFRNTWSWGKWDGGLVWGEEPDQELQAVAKLEDGLCPECGEPVEWAKPVAVAWLKVWQAKPIGGGYYRLDTS